MGKVKNMNAVVVNATALDASGALTVLRQFVENIPQDQVEWIVFISDKIDIVTTGRNVRLVPISGVKSLLKRFIWDAFGVKKWLKQNGIKPTASVSLQNTNFRTGYKIRNYIYYHQSIPFFPKNWSPFRQRTLWFYKTIYPFFVSIFLNRRTEIFVQLRYIKDGFVKRFGFDENKIHIIWPTVQLPDIENIATVDLPDNTINLFYPATGHFYKNHKVVLDALNSNNNNNFVFYTTLPDSLGVIPFEKVLEMYKSADALVFPSYIETFGLPLIEAASFGLPILAADLPYAREVLDGYGGVTFIEYDDAGKWAAELQKLEKGKRYSGFKPQNRSGWSELFNRIKNNYKNV